MHRICNCIHIPARNHACITPDPWQKQANKSLVPCATRRRTTGRIVGWYFVAGLHYYAHIHVLPEAHTLPYPATAQHSPLGNDSPIFACLLDFRGVEPLNRRVRSSVQMIPHEEFDGSAKDSFFIFVPLYLPYSFILCTLLVSKQCCHC